MLEGYPFFPDPTEREYRKKPNSQQTKTKKPRWHGNKELLEKLVELHDYTCTQCQNKVVRQSFIPKNQILWKTPEVICFFDALGFVYLESIASIEHIFPRSQGGTDADDNVTLNCINCNSFNNSKFTKEIPNRSPLQNYFGLAIGPKQKESSRVKFQANLIQVKQERKVEVSTLRQFTKVLRKRKKVKKQCERMRRKDVVSSNRNKARIRDEIDEALEECSNYSIRY